MILRNILCIIILGLAAQMPARAQSTEATFGLSFHNGYFKAINEAKYDATAVANGIACSSLFEQAFNKANTGKSLRDQKAYTQKYCERVMDRSDKIQAVKKLKQQNRQDPKNPTNWGAYEFGYEEGFLNMCSLNLVDTMNDAKINKAAKERCQDSIMSKSVKSRVDEMIAVQSETERAAPSK